MKILVQLFYRTQFGVVRFLHHQTVLGIGSADQTCYSKTGGVLGGRREPVNDQPHQPPKILSPVACFAGVSCSSHQGLWLPCSTHFGAMVHAFLIHTLRAPQAEDTGLCRVLYSCVFGAENSPDDPRPHSAERDRLLRKEQILAVAR